MRHGQSAWNAQGRWQGLGDPPLSDHGYAQAREAARRIATAFAGESIARLYCSRLQRARQTAAEIGPALGLVPEPVDGLEDEDLIADETVAVTISNKGYVKRMSLDTYRSQSGIADEMIASQGN